MAVRLRTLGEGRLGDASVPRPLNTPYEIYRVPVGKSVLVRAMRFVNTSTNTAHSLTIILRSQSPMDDERPLMPRDVFLKPGLMLILDEELALASGDSI